MGIAVDDYEAVRLIQLLDQHGARGERNVIVVNHHPQGTGGVLSRTHEYFVTVTDPDLGSLKAEPSDESVELRNYMRSGTAENNYRYGRWKSFYPLLVEPSTNKIVGAEAAPPLGAPYSRENTETGLKRVFPINSTGEERVWRNSFETGKRLAEQDRLKLSNSGVVLQEIHHQDKRRTLFSNWTDAKYNAGTQGTNVLSDLGLAGGFDYPKSVWTVTDGLWALTFGEEAGSIVDYFAGSGTTGHAVIRLNREDDGSRKYILVEMGDYFDTVLKPRLQKVVFSEVWKNGAPVRRANPKDANNPYNGVSHCLKVLRLESYEDALDNIEFDTGAAPGTELGLDFHRDYELRYALDWESRHSPTRLAVGALEMPFDYTLTLRRESGTVTVKPDLPETFAYLIGLHVRRRFWTERGEHRYLIMTGTLHADGAEVVVLWRNCTGWSEQELQKEKDWWKQHRGTLAPDASRVYVNGACAVDGHECLDLEFKRRMHSASVH